MTSVLASLLPNRPHEPGLAVALIRGSEVVERRCVGLADLAHHVPITPHTRFHIVSASKTFVAASILALAKRGTLMLDDPVRKHLPELPTTIRAVTLRHLLSMTSGLRDVLEIERLRGEWRPSPSRVQDLLDLAWRQTAMSAPAGEQYMYANVNFVLLEEILRRKTGDAHAFRKAAFYDPLGLASTADRPHEEIVLPDLAEPYVPTAGGWVRGTDLLGISGDTLTTSLDDLARWAVALKAGLADEMATPAKLNDGRTIHYGLGLCIRRYRGLTVLGHSGSQPGYKIHLCWIPERDIGAVVLANREDVKAGPLAISILDAALGDTQFPAPHPSRRPCPEPPSGIDGTYVDQESGEWMKLTAGANGTLAGETLGDALSLYHAGDGVFRHADDYRADTPAEIVLDASSTSCPADVGGRRSQMIRVTPPVYGADALAAVTGLYESPEIDSRHRVALGPDGLTITYGLGTDRGRTFAMEALAPDLFLVRPTAPGVAHRHVFRFLRESGAVVAVRVTMDRLRGITLTRTGA